MELFAAVSDMLGEGLPLSYLFITTEANAAPYTKQNALIEWMKALRLLGIAPRFTLSDKDQSEINALGEVWPEAKHQLCFWHVLRAIKRRLSQNEPPGLYSALEANAKFKEIDLGFVPLRQMSAEANVCTCGLLYRTLTLILAVQGSAAPPPNRPLARIRLCVNGRPAVITPNVMLTLTLPNSTKTVVPAADNNTSVTNGHSNSGDLEIDVIIEDDKDDLSDGEDGLARCVRKQAAGTLEEYKEDGQRLPGDGGHGTLVEEDDFSDEEIDIIREAEELAQASDSEDDDDVSGDSSDEEDEGDGDFVPITKGKGIPKAFKATGGKKHAPKFQKDANYAFCPLAHRLSIINLVSKHFCQHPILREHHGQRRTPAQIWRDAVLEAYYHCRNNNLREVWGYLWTNWYAEGKWELWARSSYPGAIPWKRTTMLVEALWRNFKRLVLYQYNRPCVDFATYALVTQGIAPY